MAVDRDNEPAERHALPSEKVDGDKADKLSTMALLTQKVEQVDSKTRPDNPSPTTGPSEEATLSVVHATKQLSESDHTSGVAEPTKTADVVERVAAQLRKLAASPLKPDGQASLADLVELRDALQNDRLTALLESLEVAAIALGAAQPNTDAAAKIGAEIRKRLKSAWPLSNSPPANVTLGLLLLVILGVVGLFVAVPLIPKDGTLAGLNPSMLTLVAVAGAFGSVVSIARRIGEFGRAVPDSPVLVFLTGFFKPIVGVGFALFVFAALKSGIVAFVPPQANDAYFYAALAFLAGFSEKFAPDLVIKAEEAVSASTRTSTVDETNVKVQSGTTRAGRIGGR